MIYFNGSMALSFNAVFTFIDGARNIGKSWTFKRRALRRAYKRGKATYWLRRYDDETKHTAEKFLNAKLLKQLQWTLYHKRDNPDGGIKQEGRKIFVKNRAGKWVLAVQFITLSDSAKYRSADDCNFDTIVFDEYTTTAERYKYYRGDEVKDFIDLFISLKREEKMRCIFLGNKETILNPYKRFFGIQPLPLSFQGMRRYKRGSVVIQQVNDVLNAEIAYDAKLTAALCNTSYLAYLLEGEAKNAEKVKYRTLQRNAYFYAQFLRQGCATAVYFQDGFIIFTDKLDLSRTVYTDTGQQLYPKQKTLLNRHRQDLYAITNAVIDNRVAYTSPQAVELAEPLLRWLIR